MVLSSLTAGKLRGAKGQATRTLNDLKSQIQNAEAEYKDLFQLPDYPEQLRKFDEDYSNKKKRRVISLGLFKISSRLVVYSISIEQRRCQTEFKIQRRRKRL